MASRSVSSHFGANPDEIINLLPPRLRSCVNTHLLGSYPVDLLVFGADAVITSKDLLKAIGDGSKFTRRLVAVARDFTEDASDLIVTRGGLLFSASESSIGWSDQSWHDIRQRKPKGDLSRRKPGH